MSQICNIYEILLLEMLEENFYKEYTISVLSYCKFVIYYVGYIITVLTYRGHGVARPRIIICHTVNFVLTHIEKTCNEQYHNFSLQEENVKPNLNSMTIFFLLFIFVHLSSKYYYKTVEF